MLKVVGNALNKSFGIEHYEFMLFGLAQATKGAEILICQPFILVGCHVSLRSELGYLSEFTRSYFALRFDSYTPCAVMHCWWSRLFNIFSVDMRVCFFVSGLGCHYSQLHFNLQPQITLAHIQFLQQHFQCHIQYYSRLTVTVCKHTAALCTATSVLLLLGVLQCCDQHSVPGVPYHVPYPIRIGRADQNNRGN